MENFANRLFSNRDMITLYASSNASFGAGASKQA